MMKLTVLTLVFYFLLLLQGSFLVHFSFLQGLPNLVVVALILVNLLEEQKEKTGLLLAFPAGFLLDLYSEKFLGFFVLILLFIALLIKLIFKKYVRVPFAQRP